MRRFLVLPALLLCGCFVPDRAEVAFDGPTPVLPSIASIDGDGVERAVSADVGDAGLGADHRVAAALVLRGSDLDQATAVELRDPEPTAQSPCLAGPGADPCVLHDASTGLLLQAGGTAVQQTIALPPSLATGAYLLALIAPAGEAQAQVVFLQGEPGLDCWDRDEDRECDLASEDVDGDGTCSTADCLPQTALQCTGPDCVLNKNLLVAGDVTATATVTGESVVYGEQAVGEAVDGLDSRVATLESATTATELAVLQAQVDGLELDLGAVDARLAAVEADFATATALADLDARVSVVELDYATGTEVDAIDVRLSAVETTVPTDSALSALDARVTVVEGDYATGTALGGVDARLATVEGDYATGTALGGVDARLAAVEADYATDTDLQALEAVAAKEIKTNTTCRGLATSPRRGRPGTRPSSGGWPPAPS